MSGETNLALLVRTMKPVLAPEEYVFCTVESGNGAPCIDFPSVWAVIREEEAVTLIMERVQAEKNLLPFEGVFRRITLHVHSSLSAVGLTASVASSLAAAGISANVVAAFYHDHIFVPNDKASLAVENLRALSCSGVHNS